MLATIPSIIIIFLLLVTGCFFKYTEFIAEPLGIYPNDDNHPDVVTADFYLQQRNIRIVDVIGTLHVKQPLQNLTMKLTVYLWTGGSYTDPSGGSGREEFPNACEVPFFGDILRTYEPKELLDVTTCSFLPGNLTTKFNVDELMHTRSDKYLLGKVYFTLSFLSNAKSYFGFGMELEALDYDLYKYTMDDF